MMRTTSGAPRIVKRKLADGDVSFTFSVVRHVRILGKPNHMPLATIGTFRQSEFSARAEEFWSIVDDKLDELVRTNKLWNNDTLKVENAFAKHIPRPAAVVTTTVDASPESNYEIMQSLISAIAEKATSKLKREHGIEL